MQRSFIFSFLQMAVPYIYSLHILRRSMRCRMWKSEKRWTNSFFEKRKLRTPYPPSVDFILSLLSHAVCSMQGCVWVATK